jgi:nucleoside-diphosphate-sugar epimerase
VASVSDGDAADEPGRDEGTGEGDLHVVLGTGPVGTAVARAVLDRDPDARVRAVNRSGTAAAGLAGRVELRGGDLADRGTAREACAGASVVYFCVQPAYTEWPERFPPLLEGAIEGAAAADAVLVAAENLYAYGPVEGPLVEDLPYEPVGPKGRTRAAMARTLLDAHEAGRVRATIGRASDFYGPGVTDSTVGERVFARALAGKPVYLVGDPDAAHTYTYVEDFGDALVTLGAEEAAHGEAWHVPNPETLSTREFVRRVFERAGTEVRIRTVPGWLFRVVAQFNPTLREVRELLYEFEEPFVVDHSKYEAAFGAEPTPHREAIEATLAWYRERAAGSTADG